MSSTSVTCTNTVGITEQFPTSIVNVHDRVGLQNTITTHRAGVKVDTWRPVLRPDNQLVLVCRTPITEHDSSTGLTHMTLWTFQKDGTREKIEVSISAGIPAANSWTKFGHPEWAPDGKDIVVAAETSTECQIYKLDATGFGA